MEIFKDKSGIYGLMFEDEVIYVGQSKNLAQRLKSHHREHAFDSVIKDIIKDDGRANRCKALAMYHLINENRENISFIILKETEELNKWEEHYIKLFQPRYNYIGVDVPYDPVKRAEWKAAMENYK